MLPLFTGTRRQLPWPCFDDKYHHGALEMHRKLEECMRELDIYDLEPFYSSAAFAEAGFSLAPNNERVILKRRD